MSRNRAVHSASAGESSREAAAFAVQQTPSVSQLAPQAMAMMTVAGGPPVVGGQAGVEPALTGLASLFIQ